MSDTAKKFEFTSPMAILASGALIAGAILFTRTEVQVAAPPVANAAAEPAALSVRAPSPSEDHWRGSAAAEVVLVEYSDFECPYCAMIHPTLKRIVEESEGRIAWVYRHLPLESIHAQARPAAAAAECVAEQLGSEGFFAFADAAFENQQKLGAAFYAETAAKLGADPSAFASCIASGRFDAAVNEDAQEAQRAGAQGTPFTIIVKGGMQAPFGGALPYEQIRSVISAFENRL